MTITVYRVQILYQMLVHAIFPMHDLNSSMAKKILSNSQHSGTVDFYVIAVN